MNTRGTAEALRLRLGRQARRWYERSLRDHFPDSTWTVRIAGENEGSSDVIAPALPGNIEGRVVKPDDMDATR